MLWLWALVVVSVLFSLGALYDWRYGRGARRRSAKDISNEALQNRLDSDVVRRFPGAAGQSHDWMTYRQRDHQRPDG
jgi:hypothetical protein